MFPFNTDKFTYITNLTQIQVENVLRKNIIQDKISQTTHNCYFYGSINNKKAKFKLGNRPSRNHFGPLVVLNWETIDNRTQINGHLRMDRRILIQLSSILFVGIFLTISNNNISEFLVSTFLFLFFILISLVFYNYGKRKTTIKLTELMRDLNKAST